MLLNLNRARAMMAEHHLDALVATTPENITYTTGFGNWTIYTFRDLEAYGVVPLEGPLALVIPIDAADYLAQVPADVSRLYAYGTFHTMRDPSATLTGAEAKLAEMRDRMRRFPSAIAALVQALEDVGGSRTLGVDERGMPPHRWRALVDALTKRRVTEAHDLFRCIRVIKTEDEIHRLRTAVCAVEQGMLEAFRRATVGATEADLEVTFRETVVAHGATPGHFETSAGTRSAGCFPTSADYRIRSGDIVRSDCGGRHRGYWADTGRTAAVGSPPPKLARYLEVLRGGIMTILDMVRPGVTVGDLFRAGIDAVRSGGIPHYERHHVGHSIGLEFYEAPVLADTSERSDIHHFAGGEIRLEPGMVINVELPYYELGLGGLQIEDTLVVRPTGYELLTTANRALLTAGM